MSIPPAGASPAGLLVPLNYVIEGEPPIFLADAIDPTTGEYLSIEQGFDPTDAWVLGQLAIARGTGSAVQDQGRDFRDITHISERHQRILDQEIRRPLKPLVSDREIEIRRLEIIDEGDGYSAYLSYRQISTGVERDEIAVPLGALSPKAVS